MVEFEKQKSELLLHAAVTGASKGIGRAISTGFSRHHRRVALLARNEEGLRETYDLLSETPNNHLIQPCDISMWNDCQKAAERIEDQFGYLNILVNDAFGVGEESLEDMDPGAIHEFFATSASGTALITKALLPLLIKGFEKTSRKSQIINVVADWGFPMHNIFTGTPIYVAGKYAVHGFGVALQREVAPKGINVTNIYPGITASSLNIDDNISTIRKEFGNKAIPLKDIVDIILSCTTLSSSVIRHLVVAPDNPDYDGL
jgi:NAD(P)-dependent dehydrogenase (short-subunit alcohol dehydrogenase family)